MLDSTTAEIALEAISAPIEGATPQVVELQDRMRKAFEVLLREFFSPDELHAMSSDRAGEEAPTIGVNRDQSGIDDDWPENSDAQEAEDTKTGVFALFDRLREWIKTNW